MYQWSWNQLKSNFKEKEKKEKLFTKKKAKKRLHQDNNCRKLGRKVKKLSNKYASHLWNFYLGKSRLP